MKIALPTKGKEGLEAELEGHFGRAQYYTVVELDRGEIEGVSVEEVPYREHGPGDIPNWLKGLAVDLAPGLSRASGTRSTHLPCHPGV